ncbi:MAG: DNA-formamidopyrimidine glycosylase family protein [Acidobacteriota bacterium]
MPEGDTIFRAARTLARALDGKTVLRFRADFPAAGIPGRTVSRVEARGKHLLMHFDDGRALHSHMGMTGSWHIYRPGERWRKSERSARAVLETEDFVAVCFSAPLVELLSRDALARHPSLSRLGPDLLRPEFEVGAAASRLRERGDAAIGEALLHQGSVAGIGNIFKSEALFVCRLNPFVPVGKMAPEDVDRVVAEARRLMSASVEGQSRRTRESPAGPRYWVYRRSGQPCLACGAAIRMRRQGDAGRSTYWCPRCQAEKSEVRGQR